jgi:hypothetical protein
MTFRTLTAAAFASGVLACGGSVTESVADAGADRGYSDHGHQPGTVTHSHGDPEGITESHAHGLHVNPDGSVLWATHQGVFRLDDSSAEPTAVILGPDFRALAVDPFDANRLWASGIGAEDGVAISGVVESIDGGVTWANVGLAGEVSFDVLAGSSTTPDTVVGAGGGSVWRSADSGRTWESSEFAGECTGIVLVDGDDEAVLLSGSWGIARVTADADPEMLFRGPVTGLRRWSGGIAYAIAGSLVVCGEDVTDVPNCEALQPPSTHPIRQVVDDASEPGRWYTLTNGPELYTRDPEGRWELLATGL